MRSSLAANSSEFIAMCDGEGDIFFLNEAGLSMSGFQSLAEAQVGQIWDLFTLEERGFLKRELFERSLISGREEIETRVQNIITGQARWVMLAVFPVRDSQGHPVALAAMGRDITERKNAEGMLSDAARRKDEFLATLAHELRNPLAPISNALQVWSRLEPDPEQLSKIRSLMERQVQQLKHLIDDLLDVSRISQGKIQLRREELNLSSVLESAIESVRPSIDEAGHTLHLTLPVAPIFLCADRGRLIQILGNLIHNSAKYTQKKGQIWISARAEGLWVEICIKDSGVGIAPEMLASIFQPFTQIHASRGLAQGGIGIGLSLVKNLVALHGGMIEAHSEGLDKGSEFIVKLPLLRAQDDLLASAASPAQASEGARGAVERQRVLIVDDERASADTLAMMLEMLGQDVVVAYDAPEALRLVGSIRPDFVFSDIAMPGMDGMQLAREVSKLPGVKATLVAVTGYGQEQDRRRILEAGFKFHLVKPTTIQAVREVLGCNQNLVESTP